MIYALIIVIAGYMDIGWFDSRESCLAAARDIVEIAELSPDDGDYISCSAFDVDRREDRKS